MYDSLNTELNTIWLYILTVSFNLIYMAYSITTHWGGLNLNFQAHPYELAFLNPWNIPNKIQVWNLLHKLLVLIGELILILGSKIHNFLPFFGVAPKFHSKFSQKFKNWVFKKFSQKITKKLLVSGPENRFLNSMFL